jgi:DNA-binding NarL/FixJ family response regulator
MKHGTVLLADAHSPMLEGVRSLLEDRFDAVVMVAGESSLLEAIEKLHPEIAVVDVSFPLSDRESGNVVPMLHKRFPDLRLIALSVHDEAAAADRMLKDGAAGFVLKRSAVTDLLTAIEAVFEGRTYVSPGVRPSRPTNT